MDEPESVKVVLLGESGVGKTSIINQFVSGKFNPRISTSVSAQFVSKTREFPEFKKKIRFDIWDTVGQEKYRALTQIFYRDAKVIILVYDITKVDTFNAIKDYWHKEVLNNVEGKPIMVLVANKTDLYLNEAVNKNEGKQFADKVNAMFQTTSAMNNEQINTLFENIGKKIIDPVYDYQNSNQSRQDEKTVKLNKDNKNNISKGKNCC